MLCLRYNNIKCYGGVEWILIPGRLHKEVSRELDTKALVRSRRAEFEGGTLETRNYEEQRHGSKKIKGMI